LEGKNSDRGDKFIQKEFEATTVIQTKYHVTIENFFSENEDKEALRKTVGAYLSTCYERENKIQLGQAGVDPRRTVSLRDVFIDLQLYFEQKYTSSFDTTQY
jgi:hypothetical protein